MSARKPATLTEVAKQRELSGTLEADADSKLKKQLSNAKCRELSGCDIFAPPPEILPRPTMALDFGGSVDHGESRNVSDCVCAHVNVSFHDFFCMF